MKMDLKLISSVLFVRDIQASRRFYEELLGQKVLMDHGPNIGYEGGFALWQTDHANLMIFGTPSPEGRSTDLSQMELYFETETLDDVCRQLEAGGVTYVHPIKEQPWGQRVVRIYDPDQHIIDIGEPMPVVILRYLAQGMKEEEIAQKTFMPVEIIRQIAATRAK